MSGKNNPDPIALDIAAAMQKLLAPAQVILNGSRAAGEHRPDSDVDLMAVFDDDGRPALGRRGAARQLLETPQDGPKVHVYTISRAEFEDLAIRAQSFPGQAARHGVTPEGKPLGLPAAPGEPSAVGTPRRSRFLDEPGPRRAAGVPAGHG